MARLRKPINWKSCPVRKCRSAQTCLICGEPIAVGEMYYDALNNKKAHTYCVDSPAITEEALEQETPAQKTDRVEETEVQSNKVQSSGVRIPLGNMLTTQEVIERLLKVSEDLVSLQDKLEKQLLSISDEVAALRSQVEELNDWKESDKEIPEDYEPFAEQELNFYND